MCRLSTSRNAKSVLATSVVWWGKRLYNSFYYFEPFFGILQDVFPPTVRKWQYAGEVLSFSIHTSTSSLSGTEFEETMVFFKKKLQVESAQLKKCVPLDEWTKIYAIK